jgi:hypothetical protein
VFARDGAVCGRTRHDAECACDGIGESGQDARNRNSIPNRRSLAEHRRTAVPNRRGDPLH